MKLNLITHFYNEEMLIADWINHHKNFFDHAILINHGSTDNSLEIAKNTIPDGWQIVDTKLPNFDAVANDHEVMEWEKTLPKDEWKMVLNMTEYLFTPNLKEKLEQWSEENKDIVAFGSRAACLVDKEEKDLESPIWKDRQFGFMDYENGILGYRKWRYIHKAEHGHYDIGRHGVKLPHLEMYDFLHLHLLFSPWPQCKERKLQIQNKIPNSDKVKGFGIQHLVDDKTLTKRMEDHLKVSFDLMTHTTFKTHYEALIEKPC